MKKLILAAVAILAVLFAPMAYSEYQIIKRIGFIQDYYDNSSTPFKVFRPPTASLSSLTNYTNLQSAITDDGAIFYYGKGKFYPSLIEPMSLTIIQHAYFDENSSAAGFATSRNGQDYRYLPNGNFRALSFFRNTTYARPTEIIIISAGISASKSIEEESVYSKAMISLAESMR